MTYADKPMSLIERKKQQWAREREELAGLCAPWGVKDVHYDDPFGRKRYNTPKTTPNNNYTYPRKDPDATTPRRSSLPPLYKNQYNSYDRYEIREKDPGGETSGYGSDNPNSAEYPPPPVANWHQSGYESSSSCRDDRLRWGEKGVSKFWGSRENLNYTKAMTNEPPGWVKRGLESDTEIVVANTSPAESPQQDYGGDHDRPGTTSSSNCNNRATFVRGQNVHLDQLEIIEREKRRQIALAHQDAIRKQLEEREQRRKEERQRRIQEEREEELRIEREQEMERKRREHEQKLLEEKQERERRRKEAIQEALEIAEKEAKLAKMKQKMLKQNINSNINLTESIVEKDKVPETLEECNKKLTNSKEENSNLGVNNNNRIHNGNNNKVSNLDQQNNNFATINTNKKEENSNIENDNNQKTNSCQIIVSPRENSKTKYSIDDNNNAQKMLSTGDNTETRTVSPPPSIRAESVALLLQQNLDTFQNMQYAVLVPAINPTSHATIPIAVPISLTTDRTLSSARTENRVLTPTQWRNEKKIVRDSSTQTDFTEYSRSGTADFSQDRYRDKVNSDISYENKSRKEERRKSRNEDRMSREGIEERPKWGANRPPTRYMKQSEKDPLYQKRKLRQKMRETKVYDDKNSSDESQTESTRAYRKRGYGEKRHTRALWRKNDHFFARNIKMYQTEIIPLDSDKTQIYYTSRCGQDCCCHCRCSRKKYPEDKIDILKIEHTHSPRENVRYKSEIIDAIPLPDFNQNIRQDNEEQILEKLSCLQDEIPTRDNWDRSPRSPPLSASTRYN